MVAVLLLALGSPVEVRVEAFDVPETIHDGVRLEVARWPMLLAEAYKAGDAVRFRDGKKGVGFSLRGWVRAAEGGKKLVIEAEVRGRGRRVWGETFELTEFARKVEFLDETRAKIVAGVKKALKE